MEPILNILERCVEQHADAIDAWLEAKRAEAPPFVYNSVDLRHSGGRLVPVDTNLYPAGFNNLSAAGRKRAVARFMEYISHIVPDASRVLIVPENHTRNLAYLDNLHVLQQLLQQAGFEVRIGSLIASAGEVLQLTSMSGHDIEQHPLVRDKGTLSTEDGFAADLILLNNDMTAGVPDLLSHLSQPILPPPALGWHWRTKSRHFYAYRALVREFCEQFSLDPWLLSATFRCAEGIHFKHRKGLDVLAEQVDVVLKETAEKYREHGISDDPYAYVKADSGTYGMGIITVQSGSEILEINKKQRNKMEVIKEGQHVHRVIVQEGIPTVDAIDGKPAEPMIYLVDGVPVGGMYRVNATRDAHSSLNAGGVEFIGMCDEKEDAGTSRTPIEGCRFYSYGLVAALAALAVPREEGVVAALPNCA